MELVRIGDVYLNLRSGHQWRVILVGPLMPGHFSPYRMVTLQNERSGTIKRETSLYLLNTDVHTRLSTHRA